MDTKTAICGKISSKHQRKTDENNKLIREDSSNRNLGIKLSSRASFLMRGGEQRTN